MTRTIVLLALCMAGCELDYSPDVGLLHPADPDAGTSDAVASARCSDSNPAVTVSFSTDIRPLTIRSTGGCGCHRTNTTAGFNLGTYDNLRRGGLLAGTRIIIPGNPCDSVLVQKLGLAPPFGARMPYNGPPYFTAAEQQVVRDWIAEGALDN